MPEFRVTDFKATLRNGPCAWPGGYPLYFVMADGEAMSFEAAKANARRIMKALWEWRDEARADKQWLVRGVEINWEDSSLFCCHTNKRIESAYAEEGAVS